MSITPEPHDEKPAALAKPALRRLCRTRRDAVASADRAAWSRAACDHVLALINGLAPAGAIGGYWPIGSELDCRPALAALAQQGRVVGLPVVAAPSQPLIFRCWRDGDILDAGAHGTLQPGSSQALCQPKLVLVPLLGFDAAGHRLGYGGGYYDRTLAALRSQGSVLAVGLAYDLQALDSALAQDHDAPLDWIVTERGARPVAP